MFTLAACACGKPILRLAVQSGPCSSARPFLLVFRRNRDRLRFIQTAVIDREPAVFHLGVNIDEPFAETDLVPGIILLALDRSGHHQLKGKSGSHEERILVLHALESYSVQRTLL